MPKKRLLLGSVFLDPSRVSGEGNGNPLQYSCLDNPMDGGAWWAAVHGGLPSMGSHRVGHDRSNFAAAAGYLAHCRFSVSACLFLSLSIIYE